MHLNEWNDTGLQRHKINSMQLYCVSVYTTIAQIITYTHTSMHTSASDSGGWYCCTSSLINKSHSIFSESVLSEFSNCQRENSKLVSQLECVTSIELLHREMHRAKTPVHYK